MTSRQDALSFLALGLLAAVPYLPAMLWGGFVWDDNLYIKVDPVRDVSGLWQIWFSPSELGREDHYWPLVYTTFWLEHKLWGFDPTGYHIVNVLLHLANTLLVVASPAAVGRARRMGGGGGVRRASVARGIGRLGL